MYSFHGDLGTSEIVRFDSADLLSKHSDAFMVISLLGPYLAQLNLDKLLTESEKGDKPEDKVLPKFGMDADRSGMDRTGTNRYRVLVVVLSDVLVL